MLCILMRFSLNFLTDPAHLRRERASRQALRDLTCASFGRLAAQAAANFRQVKGFFQGATPRAPFIDSKPQRRLAPQVEVPLSGAAASSRKITGMVMGRLVADREDWTRVLRSRC
jgi:hypothetical protein